MKGWQKIAVGIAVIVIPGSMIAVGAIGIYKVWKKRKEAQKEENKDG
jgi:hypothetical protein